VVIDRVVDNWDCYEDVDLAENHHLARKTGGHYYEREQEAHSRQKVAFD